jgi:hypothetical protein
MRQFASGICVLFPIILLLLNLAACGGSATSTSPVGTPTKVNLTPTTASIDLGTTLQFNASVLNAAGNLLSSVPVIYTSSNPGVLTFVPSAGGLACAGRWDTLGQVCLPSGVGVTQVTASANGVVSPAVTVYVHQHVDLITVSLFRPPNDPIPQPDCVTLAQAPGIQNYLDFQANAFRMVNLNGVPTTIDISNTVGSFTFSQTNSTVAKISTTDPELNNNNGNQITQARFTAAIPGITQIFASVSGVTSPPAQVPDSHGNLHPFFETCLVQSINLQVGNAVTNTSFAVTSNAGGGIVITPTVIDRLGNSITNPIPTLTFISSSPANGTLTVASGTGPNAGTGTVSTKAAGGVSFTAVCTPPGCNVGTEPPLVVYSSTTPAGVPIGTPITGLITGSPSTTGTVYVTSTQCVANGQPINGCQPLIFPVSIKDNSVGSSATLPSAPNSIFFPAGSSAAYLGSAGGLMTFSPGATSSTVTQRTDIPGKILAMSLAGDRAIISDTQSTPNQVYVVSGLSGAGVPTMIPLLIDSVTAAAFSPDGLKMFLISNPSGGTSTMYVYSTIFATKPVPLGAPANAIGFYANGSLAYLAGPSGVTLRNACDTTYAQAAAFPSATPSIFTVVADGIHALGLESPGVDVFTFTSPVDAPVVATPGSPQATPMTCPFTVTSPNTDFVNLGQGPFTPLKLIISPDSSKAYILATNLGSVFVLNLEVNTVSAIPLAGNPVPLDATLTSDGSLLYVGANDGSVHVLSTISANDLTQVTFTNNNPSNKSSLCGNIAQTCNPDLIIAKP